MLIGDRIAELGVSHVHAGGADHLGIWRAKRVSAETAARGTLGFSDGVFGLDIAGEWVAPPAGHGGLVSELRRGLPRHAARARPGDGGRLPVARR